MNVEIYHLDVAKGMEFSITLPLGFWVVLWNPEVCSMKNQVATTTSKNLVQAEMTAGTYAFICLDFGPAVSAASYRADPEPVSFLSWVLTPTAYPHVRRAVVSSHEVFPGVEVGKEILPGSGSWTVEFLPGGSTDRWELIYRPPFTISSPGVGSHTTLAGYDSIDLRPGLSEVLTKTTSDSSRNSARTHNPAMVWMWSGSKLSRVVFYE